MKKEAAEYIHEWQITIDRINLNFTTTGSMMAADVENLCKFGYEYPIKAVIAQQYGSVPRSYYGHSPGELIEKIGLKMYMPGNLQSGVTDMEGWYPVYPNEKAFITLVGSSTPAQWANRIEASKQLGEFVLNQILSSSSSIFPKLTFDP
ncbi:MAG: hypothetical protein HY695_01185 [Deltaproteobacteria bacterium]|nr:hypothetical protein [Deltaproteobacteria bacterium]